MATLLSALETQVRYHLNETTASFWSSAELVTHFNNGIKDLWRAFLDLHQEHYLTNDSTNVSMAANTATLTGVPSDVFRVLSLEPADLTSSSTSRNLIFRAKDYWHPDFMEARASSAVDPSNGGVVYYTITGAGAPTGAPTIYVAPQLTSAVTLRLVYVPVLATKAAGDNNPIPGESDQALIAWCVAYAKAKESPDGTPDAGWLQIYATEKRNILTACTPRDESEPEVVDDFFRGWSN